MVIVIGQTAAQGSQFPSCLKGPCSDFPDCNQACIKGGYPNGGKCVDVGGGALACCCAAWLKLSCLVNL